MYSTDNGAEMMSWPDGGTTMFRGEKNTNWEGGYRVPAMIRWPGVIKPGTVINDIASHEDMLPTLLAAAGDTTVKEDLLKGRDIGGANYKVHLDGYDLGPALRGEAPWPRKEFIYWTDDGSVAALRYNNWKMVFLEQRSHGFDVWQEPFVTLRLPKLFNLRSDPFERADHEGMGYGTVAHRPRLPHRARRSDRRPMAAELPGVPAAPEARQLQPESRHGSDDQAREQLTLDRR